MKEFIKSLTKDVIRDIEERCELDSTDIQFTKDGFEVNLKYKIPKDFYILRDKCGNQLNIGDKVRTLVYYGEVDGIVKKLDFINKELDVEVSLGDIFKVKAKDSKKILDSD